MRNKKQIDALNKQAPDIPYDPRPADDWARFVREFSELVRGNAKPFSNTLSVEFCEYTKRWHISAERSIETMNDGELLKLKNWKTLEYGCSIEKAIETLHELQDTLRKRTRLALAALRSQP